MCLAPRRGLALGAPSSTRLTAAEPRLDFESLCGDRKPRHFQRVFPVWSAWIIGRAKPLEVGAPALNAYGSLLPLFDRPSAARVRKASASRSTPGASRRRLVFWYV